ncbi:MAG TPA: hypothetical protein VK714_06985 [Myxococcota bacterium]|nr:hypothetical protein [Myxococcota bacterium]
MNKHEAIEVLEDLRAHYEHLSRQWGLTKDGALSFDHQHGIRCGYLWEVEALRIAIVALKVQERTEA